MNKILLIVVAVVLVVGAIVLVNNQSSKAPSQPSRKQTTVPQAVITKEAAPKKPSAEARMKADEKLGKEATVVVTSSGFEPKSLTVKMGTKVVWMNDGKNTANVSSAVHPTHLVYPPLNLGNFERGGSVQLVFDKPGTYNYHNHLSTSQTGTITVTQ